MLAVRRRYSAAQARRAAPSSTWRIEAVVLFPNATLRSASRARRWNTFCATVCDSRNRAGANTVVRANSSERTASRPSRSRHPAARQRAHPYAARQQREQRVRPDQEPHADADRDADERRHEHVAPRGPRPAGARAASTSSASSGRNSSRNAAHLAHPDQREQRPCRGGLLGVAGDLDRQRGEPERAPQHALDHAHGADAADRHRRLAARDSPRRIRRRSPSRVTVKPAERDDRAERSTAARRPRAATIAAVISAVPECGSSRTASSPRSSSNTC